MSDYTDVNTIQHLRIPIDALRFYKKKAEENNVMVCDEYTVALQWYMRDRRKNKHHFHLASSANHKYRSMYVNTSAVNRAQSMAERDGVSVNSIVFSALVTYYFRSQRINEIAGMTTLAPQDKHK